MDWFRYIDVYCERTAPGFWDEPLNAVSNGAFPDRGHCGWRGGRGETQHARSETVR